jgi:hypothetical protein
MASPFRKGSTLRKREPAGAELSMAGSLSPRASRPLRHDGPADTPRSTARSMPNQIAPGRPGGRTCTGGHDRTESQALPERDRPAKRSSVSIVTRFTPSRQAPSRAAATGAAPTLAAILAVRATRGSKTAACPTPSPRDSARITPQTAPLGAMPDRPQPWRAPRPIRSHPAPSPTNFRRSGQVD